MTSSPHSTGRSYLSIREVLDLLVGDFPEITISKIRFLESRGLIHPERTPSGYRKFYEADVERLRWILRQQREHFLPLKVIKGRLEQELGVAVGPATLFDEDGESPCEDELVGASVAPVSSAEQTVSRAKPARSLDTGTTPILRSELGGSTNVSRLHAPSHPAGAPTRATPTHDLAPSLAQAVRRDRPTQTPPEEPTQEPAASSIVEQPAPPAAEPEIPQALPPSRDRRSARTVDIASGASLTTDELARAAGIETALVNELDAYGLISAREIAGVHCYDEESLIVARLAGQFARFGIEPRHLRTFKHAAERESGLYGQVVTPLLRQRNPDARERALGELGELAGLGTSLQAAFVKAELRNLTGG